MSNEHSENAPGHNKPVEIVINGQPYTVTQQQISYEEIVRMAFPEGPFDITYSVDYATEHGPDGTLTKGQSTKIHKEMSFNVIKSNRS
ncbi:multiubiquitin domain-containing protein [Pseudomonas sp. P154a]|uniref:multiubiquitin domain-containing protein n=1 Tax=Pseudomonas mucoides TaxID=2730424 RepID=UPI0018920248|nr:multiubiquitin domain-containing protein [Pseudomonas mucoides]MBF6042530.1 multiubiquitin domain-containing protein [Pseudomonas mucoides]